MTLHADDNAVSLLSIAMTTKLRKMRAKGRSGWDSESCTQQHLSNLLRAAVEKGDTVDVANYCAFLLARVESILPAEQPKPVASGGWMEQLGFEVRQHDDMLRIVVDDCGNEREATLTERVLWDALMTANAEFAEAPQAPAAPVAVPWDNFPAYLIDHCEGQTITEEGLQRALAAMLANPQYAAAAPAAPAVDATSDTALLDAMQRHRIALVPEFEGPWDAEIYNDDAEARPIASGNTPREALRAALAAQAAAKGAGDA